MRWMCKAVCVVGILLVTLACWSGEASASEQAGRQADRNHRRAAAPGQIPNLLQAIVEAVQRAFRELRDSIREQICGRCPVTASALVLASVLTAGHSRARRK